MKKILITLLLLAALTPLYASGHDRHKKLPLMDEELERTVTRQAAAPSWQEQLKQMQQLYNKSPKNVPSGAPLVCNEILGPHTQAVYLRRLQQLRGSIRGNKHLQGFSFVAPVPSDLAVLSLDNYELLHAFLKGLRFAKVTSVERVRPFTLALRMSGQERGALEVWIDLPTKKVYLMSDNFYSTAAGKYGLHLK